MLTKSAGGEHATAGSETGSLQSLPLAA